MSGKVVVGKVVGGPPGKAPAPAEPAGIMATCWRLALIFPIVLAVLVTQLMPARVAIPEHMLGHPVFVVPGMLTPEVGDELMDVIKRMATFPTNANDLQFYKTKHEHIGEAIPVSAAGTCDHPFLIPNQARTLCILPGRIDIARHYMMTGGFEGLKESYEDLVSRVQSFGRYVFKVDEYPEVAKLFADESFQKSAVSVCPKDKQHVDAFQYNFIINVPGQTVASHIDGVYFWGASRFQVPQWLLAVMEFSGLFKDRFIDQIQVVGYVHRWLGKNPQDGAFVYWDSNGAEKYVTAEPLLGNIMDGSKTVHQSLVYRPGTKAPRIDKSQKNVLTYKGGDDWQLIVNGEHISRNYTTNDLRISIVYRARCFESAERAARYNQNLPEDELPLESILTTLKADLIKRGKLTTATAASIAPLDLALLLMDSYIKYPLPPHALVPYNACMLPTLVPAVKPLFDQFC